MARRMIIIRPRPQGRALDIHGKMIRTGEIGEFDERTIARLPGWFAPAPEAPKPKPKPKPKASKPKSTKKPKRSEAID